MTSEFTIRPATIHDVDAIAHVQYRGWQDTYKGIYTDAYLAALPVKTEMWQKNLSTISAARFTEVLENKEGVVVGFIGGGKNRFTELKTDGEVFAFYLLKEYHGKGWGKALFIKAAERLREMGCVSFCLYVLSQNPTVGFYRRFKPDMEVHFKADVEGVEYDETGYGWSDVALLLK